MRNEIPIVYWVYRNVWSVVHIAIAITLATTAVIWCTHDQAHQLFDTARLKTEQLHYTVSNAVPWPWDS